VGRVDKPARRFYLSRAGFPAFRAFAPLQSKIVAVAGNKARSLVSRAAAPEIGAAHFAGRDLETPVSRDRGAAAPR
jgi:hypothetical protein